MTQNSLQVFKGGWDELENSIFTDNQKTLSDTPISFFIRPDGRKIFILNDLKQVETHSLTIPWDVSTIGIVEDIFVITDDAEPFGLYFKDDGTRMYVTGQQTQILFEYIIPTLWVPSSIVDTPVTLNLAVMGNAFQCIFSRDGDFVFILNGTSVFNFPLPVPWDITSNVSNTFFTPVGLAVITSAVFKTQGDKIYIGDIVTRLVHEFDLSTVFDVTTAIPTGNTFTLPGTLLPTDLFFRSNGLEFFNLSETNNTTKFHLDEDWNISTASHFENDFDLIVIGGGFPRAISWKPDGTKFIVAINVMDVIEEYTVPNKWNTTGAIKTATFSLAGIESNPSGMWWRPDGTRCYIVGSTTDVIIQLNVSTPWDVSTLSNPSISFDLTTLIPAIESSHGIYFRADGKKLYVINFNTPSIIYEFDLNTSWDITTLVDSGNLKDVNATGRGADIFFSSDGRNMFYPTTDNDRIVRYKLSTPWNVSSAVFVDFKTTDSEGQESPQGIFIRQDDGKKLFVVGFTTINVLSYDMTSEFDFAIIEKLGDKLVTETGDILVYQ